MKLYTFYEETESPHSEREDLPLFFCLGAVVIFHLDVDPCR